MQHKHLLCLLAQILLWQSRWVRQQQQQLLS
jgi:hypothetical protein